MWLIDLLFIIRLLMQEQFLVKFLHDFFLIQEMNQM